jgi:prevent-host-death family protein
MTAEVISSRIARSTWRELLDRVFLGDHDVVIERHGQPVAVLIPVRDYEHLKEELDDLRSARRAAVLLEEWRRDSSVSRPIEEIEKELIAEGPLDGRGTKAVED